MTSPSSPARPDAASPRIGLLVLDVDGVIFRGHLIVHLARRAGPEAYLRTVADAVLFELGRLDFESFLRRSYARVRGLPWREVWKTYERMRHFRNTARTIRAFREAGWRVALITSGVPDTIVKDLARRMGADDAVGLDVEVHEGRLTGRVSGEMVTPEGKASVAERIARASGLTWRQVTAVGDDRNNLPLLRRAGVSVGFRPTSPVRLEARHVLDGDDLSLLLERPGTDPHAERRPRTAKGETFWRREILRKLIHLTGVAVPLLVRASLPGTMLLLLVAIMGYLVAELFRVNGAAIPGVDALCRLVLRAHERRHVAMGPLTLALGVMVTLACLPLRFALPVILVAVVADSLAAVVGEHWGRIRWPHDHRKTVEGTLAFLAGAVCCAWVYLPFGEALFLGGVAALIESLPIEDWDNFITPVGAGLITAMWLGP